MTTLKQMLDQLIELYMSALKEDYPLLQQQAVRGFKALFAVNDLTCDNMFNLFTGVTTMKQMLDQLIGLYISALKEDSPLLQQQAVQGFKALFAVNDLLACDNMFNLFTGVTTMKQMLDQLIGLYISALKEDSPLLQQQAVRGFKGLFAVNDLLGSDDMSAIGQTIIVKVLEKTLDKDVR